MSYRIEYQWACWRLPAGHRPGSVTRFVVAIEGEAIPGAHPYRAAPSAPREQVPVVRSTAPPAIYVFGAMALLILGILIAIEVLGH